MPQQHHLAKRQQQWQPARLLLVERELTGAVFSRATNQGDHQWPLPTKDSNFVAEVSERKPNNDSQQIFEHKQQYRTHKASRNNTRTDLNQTQRSPKTRNDTNPTKQQSIACLKGEDNRLVIPEGSLEPDKDYIVHIRRVKNGKQTNVNEPSFNDITERKVKEAHSVVVSSEIVLPRYVPKLPPRLRIRGKLGRFQVWLWWTFERKSFGFSPTLTEWQFQISLEPNAPHTWRTIDVNPNCIQKINNPNPNNLTSFSWCGCSTIKLFLKSNKTPSYVAIRARGVCERGPGPWSHPCVLAKTFNNPSNEDASLAIFEPDVALPEPIPTDLCCIKQGQDELKLRWSISESVAIKTVGFQIQLSADGVVWEGRHKHVVGMPMDMVDGYPPTEQNSGILNTESQVTTQYTNDTQDMLDSTSIQDDTVAFATERHMAFEFTAGDLRASTNYHIRMYARTAHSIKLFKQNDLLVSTLPSTVPGAPTQITTASTGISSVMVEWKIPESNGGLHISEYMVELRQGIYNFENQNKIFRHGKTACVEPLSVWKRVVFSYEKLCCEFVNLPLNFAFHARIRAKNKAGVGVWGHDYQDWPAITGFDVDDKVCAMIKHPDHKGLGVHCWPGIITAITSIPAHNAINCATFSIFLSATQRIIQVEDRNIHLCEDCSNTDDKVIRTANEITLAFRKTFTDHTQRLVNTEKPVDAMMSMVQHSHEGKQDDLQGNKPNNDRAIRFPNIETPQQQPYDSEGNKYDLWRPTVSTALSTKGQANSATTRAETVHELKLENKNDIDTINNTSNSSEENVKTSYNKGETETWLWHAGASVEDVTALFALINKHNEGDLTASVFRDMLSNFSVVRDLLKTTRSLMPLLESDQFERTFEVLKRNGSRKISIEEFVAANRMSSQQLLLRNELNHLFDVLSHNGRDNLTQSQAMVIVNQRNYVSRFLRLNPILNNLRHPHVKRLIETQLQHSHNAAGRSSTFSSHPELLNKDQFTHAAFSAMTEFQLHKSLARAVTLLGLNLMCPDDLLKQTKVNKNIFKIVTCSDMSETLGRMFSQPSFMRQLAILVQPAALIHSLNARQNSKSGQRKRNMSRTASVNTDAPLSHELKQNTLVAAMLQVYHEHEIELVVLRMISPEKSLISTSNETTSADKRRWWRKKQKGQNEEKAKIISKSQGGTNQNPKEIENQTSLGRQDEFESQNNSHETITTSDFTTHLIECASIPSRALVAEAIDPLLIPSAWSNWETLWMVNALTPRCSLSNVTNVSIDHGIQMVVHAWRRACTLKAAGKLYDAIMDGNSQTVSQYLRNNTYLSIHCIQTAIREISLASVIHAESIALQQVIPIVATISHPNPDFFNSKPKSNKLTGPLFTFESILKTRKTKPMCARQEFAEWIERLFFEHQVYSACQSLYHKLGPDDVQMSIKLADLIRLLNEDEDVRAHAKSLRLPAMLAHNKRVITSVVEEIWQNGQQSRRMKRRKARPGGNNVEEARVTEEEFCVAATTVLIEEVQVTELVVCLAFAKAFAIEDKKSRLGHTANVTRNMQVVVPLPEDLLSSSLHENEPKVLDDGSSVAAHTFYDVESFLKSKRYAGLLTEHDFGALVWRRCAGESDPDVRPASSSKRKKPFSKEHKEEQGKPKQEQQQNGIASEKNLKPVMCSVDTLIDSFVETYRMQRQLWARVLG